MSNRLIKELEFRKHSTKDLKIIVHESVKNYLYSLQIEKKDENNFAKLYADIEKQISIQSNDWNEKLNTIGKTQEEKKRIKVELERLESTIYNTLEKKTLKDKLRYYKMEIIIYLLTSVIAAFLTLSVLGPIIITMITVSGIAMDKLLPKASKRISEFMKPARVMNETQKKEELETSLSFQKRLFSLEKLQLDEAKSKLDLLICIKNELDYILERSSNKDIKSFENDINKINIINEDDMEPQKIKVKTLI